MANFVDRVPVPVPHRAGSAPAGGGESRGTPHGPVPGRPAARPPARASVRPGRGAMHVAGLAGVGPQTPREVRTIFTVRSRIEKSSHSVQLAA
jgi:hypothetical protein